MAKLKMTGSYVAIITPFTEDDEVDYAKIEEIVEFQIAEGTSGIVPCGSTGEAHSLSDEETTKIIETVVKKVAKRIHVIAGAGSNCTKKAVQLTKLAKDLGCDGVLSVIPYYNKPTQEGMYAHFKAVAEVGIPVMLYNNVGRAAGPGLSAATVAKLAELPMVVSIKEASGGVDLASEIRAACDIQILSSFDSLTVPIMALGGTGVVSVLGNICPRQVADLCRAMEAGDLARARAIHFDLFRLSSAMFSETNPIPLKAAGALMGKWRNVLRLPLTRLRPDNEAKLRAALEAASLL